MKIYLAGPMQGYKNFNFPQFHLAAAMLRAAGHVVFSPAERDLDVYGENFCRSRTGNLRYAEERGFSLDDAMDADLHCIATWADAIAMLPGWEQSGGAFIEWALARYLKRKFLYLRQDELDSFKEANKPKGRSRRSQVSNELRAR